MSAVKKYLYDILLAICISFTIIQMRRLVYTGDIFGDITENYMKPPTFLDVGLFFLLIPIFLICIRLAYQIIKKIILFFNNRDLRFTLSTRKKLLFTGIVLSIIWVMYYLSYYPGGLYADSIIAINWYRAGIWDNHYPILYTFLLGKALDASVYFGKDTTWAIGLFFACQMILLAVEVLYFLYWEIKRGIDGRLQFISMIFFIFFPLIPLYGASIWKDTPFCMALLFWMMPFVDLCMELRKNTWQWKTVILNIIGFFALSFTRNNGFYVVCFVAGILFIVTIRKKIKKLVMFYVIGACAILSIFIIQNPIYNALGVIQAPRSDGLCIPLQQICAVVAYDGNITEEQWKEIDKLDPEHNIKEYFGPGMSELIRWYAEIDGGYFGSKAFAKLWLELLFQNPKLYVDEYLIITAGYWNVHIFTENGHINTWSWDYNYSVDTDYFEKWTGLSFKELSSPKRYISAAWFFWLFFISMLFTMKRFGWRTCVFFSPALGVWVTVMIASVMSAGLRFLAPMMFVLPFIFVIPNLLFDSGKENI